MSDSRTDSEVISTDPINADLRELFLQDTPLLDLRAPVEFQRGSFPGALNVPLLDDIEREKVGTCYKSSGQEKAIELGHRLITPEKRQQRVAAWSDFVRKNPNGSLFCFRGGLRSRITSQWLTEAGVDYPLIPGGYKRMRSYLIDNLEHFSGSLPFLILGGRTGSGKTLLLEHLPAHIDLEGLAKHRGSSFGKLIDAQPSNIDFENALSVEMLKLGQQFDPEFHRSNFNPPNSQPPNSQPQSKTSNVPAVIYLEDEGRMIGRVCIPQALRERMLTLPLVMLEEPMERRVDVVLKDYIIDLLSLYQTKFGEERGLDQFAVHHRDSLQKIRKRFGLENVTRVTELFDSALNEMQQHGCFDGFRPYIESLLVGYYDPMYDYQLESKKRLVLFHGNSDEVVEWSKQLTDLPSAMTQSNSNSADTLRATADGLAAKN